jgi:anhydro-N-acetylmuramic acid kinase
MGEGVSTAPLRRAIGLMSGTSLDGVDAAFLVTDGRGRVETGPWLTVPYPDALRERLRSVLGGAGPVGEVERALTEAHAEAVGELRARHSLGRVDVIGFHGHTILHRPKEGRTWQIGDGALLAARTGIDVVCDFRSADVAAGGEGAPLVPLFHAALASGLERPLAVLNIGGVANVTWIGADGAVLAFDTGPGNALIDDWCLAHLGRPLDEDGRLAAGGTVDAAHVERFLGHAFFSRKPPKSLDRDEWAAFRPAHLEPADGAATLTAMTAAAVAAAETWFPSPPRRWLVTGGGRHNRALMGELRRRLSAPVASVEAVGWEGDALEAQAFAYLAVRALDGLPLSLPTTTGVAAPTTGGRRFRPA